MFRNVCLKKFSILFLTVGCLSYGAPPDNHEGDGSADKSKTAAKDESPQFSKFISMLSTLKEKEKIRLFATVREAGQFIDKEANKDATDAVKAFAEEAKHQFDGLKACTGDSHATAYQAVIEKCMNELADGFILNRSDAEMSRWVLRGGETNPMQMFESRMAQCRRSLGEVVEARKTAKISEQSGDLALLEKLDSMLTKFDFKVESLDKRKPGPIQEEIIKLAEKAKEGINDKSCSVAKLAPKKEEKKKPAKKKKKPINNEDSADAREKNENEDKERKAEEEKDPADLVPVPRTGPTAPGAGGGDGGSGARDGQQPQQPQVPPQGFPQGGIGGAIDPSAINPNFAGFDPNALLDRLDRPDGARVGGSPSRTTGAPSFQAPPISPSQGGGNQPQPQPEQPQPQQAQQPFMPPPQQAPIIIGDPNGSSKKDESPARNTTPPPAPAKEDTGAAERKGFNDGYNQAMQMLRGGAGNGMMNGMNASMATGQKLTAGSFGGSRARGSNARGGRRSSAARPTPAFSGTGSSQRTGRGSMQ